VAHRTVTLKTPATIVVLEENPAAQELIEQALRESGHRVLVTKNPIEALELARRVRIDLVVGDVPLRDEWTVLRQLRAADRGLRVLLVRASDQPIRADFDGNATLSSPFSLEELREAVAAALGGRA
jgi:two-component system phosphate regulon response regulator PhoB